MPDENGKAKATFWKRRGAHLWGEKILSHSKGASSVQPKIRVPKLFATRQSPETDTALGFLPRSQQRDGCYIPSLCLQSEKC